MHQVLLFKYKYCKHFCPSMVNTTATPQQFECKNQTSEYLYLGLFITDTHLFAPVASYYAQLIADCNPVSTRQTQNDSKMPGKV